MSPALRLLGHTTVHGLVAACLLSLLSEPALGAIVLEPNSIRRNIERERCEQSHSPQFCLACHTDCDANRIQAAINQCFAGVAIGEKEVRAAQSVDLEIAPTAGAEGSLIPATVFYEVWWNGVWCNYGGFLQDPRNEIFLDLNMTVRAQGNNELLHREEVRRVSTMADASFLKGSIVGGGGRDQGMRRSSFALLLRTGERYRLELELRCVSRLDFIPTPPEWFSVDFLGDGGGVLEPKGAGWNELSIRVGQAAAAALAETNLRIDTLETRLENHRHVYLTGRGEGHNNTEAETSAPVFFDDDGELPDFLGDPGESRPLPGKSILKTTYPNPAVARTQIAFTLPEPTHLTIRLYDATGRSVRTVLDEARGAGEHEIVLDTAGLASGVYYYSLRAGPFSESRKLVVTR